MEKKQISGYLLGQLVATAQLLEEAVKAKFNPEDNHPTVAEDYLNEMMECPASALKQLEDHLEPMRFRIEHLEQKDLLHDWELIHKMKARYKMTDEHLDEEEFLKGYMEQLRLHFEG